jgi:hypothetical protein
MNKLSPTSTRWAIKHLQKEGDTDLFPRPFEIDVISKFKDDLNKQLQNIDISNYSWIGGRRVIVPKDSFSFRTATQLDPMDTLVLTALIRQYGSKLEKRRISIDEEIVFSYRFNPTPAGRMYDTKVSWFEFWDKSIERAHVSNGWVVIADVSSYYNQISHHTIENQLQAAGVPSYAITSIKNCLGNLTQQVSRGIPVGPHAVHLIAESAFDPIDRSILTRGYSFCRYVDDIHIFCKTEAEARIALYDLADILDSHQRLILQRHKTQILPVEQFIEYAYRILSETPLTPLEEDIIKVVDRYSDGNRYRRIQIAELTEEDRDTFSQSNLEGVLNSYLAQDEPNFVRVRWLFRRLAQVGAPGAVPLVLNNFEQFSPALADVASYLISTSSNFLDNWPEIGDGILRALRLPVIQHSDYLKVTLLNLYAQIPALDHIDKIIQMYDASTEMAQRKIVRAATALDAGYWLREQKSKFTNVGPWLKRALIAGASTFTKDEREFWLKSIEKKGTELEKLVARWARTSHK